jgi:hypothetical protein
MGQGQVPLIEDANDEWNQKLQNGTALEGVAAIESHGSN